MLNLLRFVHEYLHISKIVWVCVLRGNNLKRSVIELQDISRYVNSIRLQEISSRCSGSALIRSQYPLILHRYTEIDEK